MSEEEIKDKITRLLKKRGKMFIKDIARELTTSPATISKYLGILNAEGKVSKSEQRPYIYWQLRDK
ncbi:ArsR family transcriptional regulator [Candidatus Bathyarchaeota archaeon]|nr:ArsR family transcriptional regulator [Candidatus Bathyarchaeota archaeon]